MFPLGGGGRLWCLALLVLPCTVASTAAEQLNHLGQLSSARQHAAPTLRGKLPSPRTSQVHRHHPIVTLQASQATHLQVGVAKSASRAHSRVGRAAKRSQVHRLLRTSSVHQQMTHRQKELMKLGACRGMKLKWWIKIKKKCQKAYGADSKWDRSRLDGKCTGAWNKCNTGFYSICCTQPVGPKDLDTYCSSKNLTGSVAASADDKACDVQGNVAAVQSVVSEIKDTIKLMDKGGEKDAEEPQNLLKIYVPPKPKVAVAAAGPSPGPAMVAQAPAIAPSGISGQAPAAAAPLIILGPKEKEHKAIDLEARCDKLEQLTKEALEKIGKIKSWAKKDGIRADDDGAGAHHTGPQDFEKQIDKDVQEINPENSEAKDPDLVFSLKGVLKMGNKLDALVKLGKFCSKAGSDDEEDDDDEEDAPVEEDLSKDPTKEWVSDTEEEQEQEEEDEPDGTKVNETAVLGLLEWESDMNQAVKTFETQVHPHGYKWWRYRYEYTVVESIVVAWSVMLLYAVMWALSGVSFSKSYKFYKTGLPQRNFRYAWAYFVFNAAALMVMVFTAYMLYIPWGKQNIFNWFAEAVHYFFDGSVNVPFLGYSWLYMVLDVQFQLFACFTLYSLFIIIVVANYVKALREWKTLGNDEDVAVNSTGNNVALYRHLDSIMKRRVRNTPHLKQMFLDLKLRLRGVDGLDTPDQIHEFQFHLYLTEALGKSLETLVEVSLTTNVCLAMSVLLVGVLANHYQVAFMYFLPGFAVIGMLLFVCGYLVSRYYRMLSDTDDHKKVSAISVHSYCRAVQIILYCIFFSFARLLLSNDIFEQYPTVYLSALIGLVAMMTLLGLFAGQVVKETTCALVLPPHVPDYVLRHHLQHIVHWHEKHLCHDCGSEQLPEHLSHSKEWAGKGKKTLMDRPSAPGSTLDSGRLYSWRG